MYFLTISAVLIIGFIIPKKYPQYSSQAITLIVISFILGSSEILKLILDESEWTPDLYLLLGMNFQTGCLFLIISRINWISNLVSLSILQTYICTRALDFDSNPLLRNPVLITLIIYLILLPYFCYSGESEDRRIFASLENLQESQKGYEYLLRSVVPSAIIMMRMGKILFSNNKSKEMFQIHEENDLLGIFSQLKVIVGIIRLI
jgi:hypothetical protein